MTRATAIRIHRFGGPEVLEEESIELPAPGRGEALVRVEFAGVNFIDIFQREGVGREPNFPVGIGVEGAGIVEAIGPDVTDAERGDRVAWEMLLGSYATHAVLPADRLIRLPEKIDTKIAAASVLQGLTAHCLTTASYSLGKGDVCLVRAAAGGVSLLLCQMARRVGAQIIGTVSTEQKAAAARASGADHVFVDAEADIVEQVNRLTDGEGVDVVYDGVGRDTFDKSLACLGRDGVLVLYGQASGQVPPLDLRRLAPRALHVTRGGLVHAAARTEMLARAGELFAWIEAGEVTPRIDEVLTLHDAAQAHERLASRQAIGKLLLATA